MNHRAIGLILAAAAMAACQSPQSRIRKNQAAFDASTPESQRAITEGRVEVGFTPEQVVMSLGKPERISTKKTAESTQEVWAYGAGGGSRVGIGFGLSSFGGGGGSSFGSSIGVDTDVSDPKARVRVVFENGKVSSVERREK